MSPVRVLIADDEPLARAGLALIVGVADDLSVVGEAATGPQTLDEAARLRPDVLLLDIQLPGCDGIAVTRALRAAPDPPRIVIITTFGLDDYLHRALAAGADGFLLKDAPAEAIQEAVHAAHRGEAVLSPRMTRRLIDRYAAGQLPDPTPPAGYAELTGREREVLRLISRGRELFVFDAERYRTEVVPALVLLRTGEPVPWLAEVFAAATRHEEYGYHLSWPQLAARCAEQPTDLARHCTWLGADLRYPGPEPRDPRTLVCPSTTCPERERCLFHQERHAVEELNARHEALVATRCLGRSQFLGRTVTPSGYTPVLDRLRIAAGDRLRALLAALGTRGAVVGHQFCGTDGIHGWLTGPETTELAARLGELPLPATRRPSPPWPSCTDGAGTPPSRGRW